MPCMMLFGMGVSMFSGLLNKWVVMNESSVILRFLIPGINPREFLLVITLQCNPAEIEPRVFV